MRSWAAWLGVTCACVAATAVGADEPIDFQHQIQPVFLEHCAKCHGESKNQGRMRLHTAAAIREKWDADEHLLVPGDPQRSELYRRLTLPAEHAKRMPKGSDPLPQHTLELVARWITQGAVLTAAEPTAAAAEKTADTEPAPPADTTLQRLPLPDVSPATQESIDRLAAIGAQVAPLYAGSSLLEVSFAGRGETAGDEDVALLHGVAEQVYALNLADAKAGAASLAPLAELKNLASLHLERSAVNDEGLAHLAGLTRLEYLNLYGTAISDAGLKQLAGLEHLKRLYLWQTNVSYDAAMELERQIPGLVTNLGYNHPVVARQRLTTEFETAKKQAEAAKAEAQRRKQQFELAQQDADAAGERVAEIEKQLQELETP